MVFLAVEVNSKMTHSYLCLFYFYCYVVSICLQWRCSHRTIIIIITTVKLTAVCNRINEKAVISRRYLRQGNVIRQVPSLSSLCQRFPYAFFNAMVTKISKWSRIQDSCRITLKFNHL